MRCTGWLRWRCTIGCESVYRVPPSLPARAEDFGELLLDRFVFHGPIPLLQGERGQCRMAGCAPFVWRDHQLQVGDALRRNRPCLALKGRAWWAKIILL